MHLEPRDFMRRLTLLLLLAACDLPGPPSAILEGDQARGLLTPCSRPGVRDVDSLWTPSPMHTARVERALAGRRDLPPRQRMVGQYAGFVRGGRRYVYGSFFARDDSMFRPDSIRFDSIRKPMGDDNPLEWGRVAMFICHGGRESFGVEYDLAADSVERLDFDAAGPPPE